MVGLPNLVPGYPRVNEVIKDFAGAFIGAGVLRIAGMKFSVGQLPIKTLPFAAGVVAGGAALGREGFIQMEFLKISSKQNVKKANSEPIYLTGLAVCSAVALAAMLFSKIGASLPTFTQLSRGQALILGSSAITSMVGLRFFGFAD